MKKCPKPNVIILAAGLSRRMGDHNKLLLPIQNDTLITKTVKLYQSICDDILVITGHQSDLISDHIKHLNVRTRYNPNYQSGHISSALFGINHSPYTANGTFIALADLYKLNQKDLLECLMLYQYHAGQKNIIPMYQKKRGNPVLLNAETLQHCQQLTDGQSIRQHLDQHPGKVAWLKAANDHFTTDLDTPEDLLKAEFTEYHLGTAFDKHQ